MNARALLAAIAVACAAAVGAALYAQHGLGMQPCPWCILQRLIYCVIALLAALGALLPAPGRRAAGGLAGLLAVGGMAAALWQNRVAARSASCDLTVADRIVSGLGVDALWPAVFEVRASCADAAVSVLGLPFEIWSLLLFIVVAGLAARVALRRG
jgi:disulfide bond formation protein DsbB